MLNYYQNKIFSGTEKNTGELGKEQEAYREFTEGKWKNDEESTSGKIINFIPGFSDKDNAADENYALMTLAADSDSSQRVKGETYFYVSENDDFALMIDEKSGDDGSALSASVISETGKDISDCILYCPETNKYFLCNINNEIALTVYKNFDYQSFNFQMLYPSAKLFLNKTENPENCSALSSNLKYIVSDCIEKEGNIIVDLEFSGTIRAIVMKSTKYADFVTHTNSSIIIPKALIESKFELLIY